MKSKKAKSKKNYDKKAMAQKNQKNEINNLNEIEFWDDPLTMSDYKGWTGSRMHKKLGEGFRMWLGDDE